MVASVISAALGEVINASIIITMVLLSVALNTAHKLMRRAATGAPLLTSFGACPWLTYSAPSAHALVTFLCKARGFEEIVRPHCKRSLLRAGRYAAEAGDYCEEFVWFDGLRQMHVKTCEQSASSISRAGISSERYGRNVPTFFRS